MHPYGISSNGNTEDNADNPSASDAQSATFSNGNLSTTVFGGGGGGENRTSNHVFRSNNHTNGCSNMGEGDEEDDSDYDFNGAEMNGGLTNGRAKQPSKSSFTIESQSDQELLQLMGQQLRCMGLDRTVSALIKESGCRLDHPTAASFRNYVMKGKWDQAERILYELKTFLDNPKHLNKMRFFLLEQKFLECIEDGKNADAVHCLQYEIAPLNYNSDKLVKICRYLFTNSLDELKNLANWEGKGKQSRLKLMEKLQNFLPPSVMLPPRRLQTLLKEAFEYQVERCPYHNFRSRKTYQDFTLLVDHVCTKNDIPCETRQIITEHREEVWFVKFSNDGTRLASGAKDGAIIIWDIDPDTMYAKQLFQLPPQSYGVSMMAWSPDDHYLLSLGPEESAEIWLYDVHDGTLKHKICQSNDDSLIACAWHKDSTKFVVGGSHGQFYQMDLNGTVLDTQEGVRVQGLVYNDDGKTIYVADTNSRIRAHNFEDVIDRTVIKEDHPIMTFVADSKNRYALLNLENNGVHLWDLKERVLLRKLQGPVQGTYAIHSCFGGANQVFAAAGSEDNKVYIWQLKHEKPISVLTGHTRTVNSVTWNPRHVHMLASASDDGTIRIWLSKRYIDSHNNKTRDNTASVITTATTNSRAKRANNVIHSVANSSDEIYSMPPSESSSPSSNVMVPSALQRELHTMALDTPPATTTARAARPEAFTVYIDNRVVSFPSGILATMPSSSSSANQAPNPQARPGGAGGSSGGSGNVNNSEDTSSSSSSSASPSSSSGSSHPAKP